MDDSGPETDQDSEFVALLTEHQNSLRLYVGSLMPGHPSVADVTQHANATAWKKRAQFKLGTHFKAWVFSIARYEVLNFRKSQARDSQLVFTEELEDIIAEELPALPDDFEDRQAALRSCINALKSSESDLILNRYFQSTPLAVYAEQVGRSVGGLKVTLHRVRNKLQSCIERKLAATA